MSTPPKRYGPDHPIWQDLPKNFLVQDPWILTLGATVYKVQIILYLEQYASHMNYNIKTLDRVRSQLMMKSSRDCLIPGYFLEYLGSLFYYLFPKYHYQSLAILSNYLDTTFNFRGLVVHTIQHHTFLCQSDLPLVEPDVRPVIIPNDQDQYHLRKRLYLDRYFPILLDYQMMNHVLQVSESANRYYAFIGDAILGLIVAVVLLRMNQFNDEDFYYLISNQKLNYVLDHWGFCVNPYFSKTCATRLEAWIGILFLHLRGWDQILFIDQWLTGLWFTQNWALQ